MNFLTKTTLGVDVGSRSIKAVKLRKKGSRILLDRYFFHDLAKTSSSFPDGVDTLEVLRAGVELNNFANASTSAGVKDIDVINFEFHLHKMKEKEMSLAVGSEISESLNQPIDHLTFDYRYQDDQKQEQVTIQAYCVRREKVMATIDLLKSARLEPKAIEPNMLAIAEMLAFNGYTDTESRVVIIDLGESVLSVALLVGQNVQFTKAWSVSCGSINETLKQKLGWTYEASEKYKLQYDLKTEGKTSGLEDLLVEEVYTQIFREIKESIEYFQLQLKGNGEIRKIYLVGGGSQIREIDKLHEMLFKIPTVVVNPLRNIDIYKDSESSSEENIGNLGPYMSVAVGLALRGIT